VALNKIYYIVDIKSVRVWGRIEVAQCVGGVAWGKEPIGETKT